MYEKIEKVIINCNFQIQVFFSLGLLNYVIKLMFFSIYLEVAIAYQGGNGSTISIRGDDKKNMQELQLMIVDQRPRRYFNLTYL